MATGVGKQPTFRTVHGAPLRCQYAGLCRFLTSMDSLNNRDFWVTSDNRQGTLGQAWVC